MTSVRWDLIERIRRAYAAADADNPVLDEIDGLSDDEREVLQWKIEEGDSALAELLRLMKEQNAATIADLRDEGP